ncbi:MAG: HAD family phosphatase [Actinomycetia bacterium]|nr:HAD family phosphatase [Actinomycetes bacterium]
MVNVVVFDLGNVLIPWDRRFLYQKLIADPDQLDTFLDEVLTLEANAALDRGTSLDEMVAGLIARHPDQRDLLQAFADRWPETVGEPISESVMILDQLIEAGIACYALSNWGRDTFELVEERYPFLKRFTGKVISGFEGVVKPEPAIFNLLCDRYGFTACDALFIDDSATNIATASSLGFAVHHFVEPDGLRTHLGQLGLLGR